MTDGLEVPRRGASARADIGVHQAILVPLLATKLQAPALSASVLERPRLHERLDGALDETTRLTVVSAPPGYGKSVAVVGWLASRRLPRAWLSLDPADNDPVRFVRYLVAALRAIRPNAGPATSALIGAGTSPSVELLGATLIGEMAAGDTPFILVLDDYHVITAEPVHRLARFLVEHGPPFAHLLLLSREDPPLPLARLRAHGRLVEVRAAARTRHEDERSRRTSLSSCLMPRPRSGSSSSIPGIARCSRNRPRSRRSWPGSTPTRTSQAPRA
jgi:ATP/maltotriose-dependent transcriptional regulator MalT